MCVQIYCRGKHGVSEHASGFKNNRQVHFPKKPLSVRAPWFKSYDSSKQIPELVEI